MISKFLFKLKLSFVKLFKLLTFYPVFSLVASIILSILLVLFGNYINIYSYRPFETLTMRLTGVIILTFFWGLNNLIYMWSKKKNINSKQIKEIKIESIDPIVFRVDTFDRNFRQAMQTVNESWNGQDSKHRKNNLYTLPWYIILGSPSSGKTSFIVESGLKFPLAHLFSQEDGKHVQPTHDVDYWVTDEAVLFDVAGQFLEQAGHQNDSSEDAQNKRLWGKFLKLLREHRPRRPINGAVLCLDLSELITLSSNERLAKAAIIHARLSEMTEVLGTRYTVHVILTKFDLIDGFHEFIAGLSAIDRTNPFGFSFDLQKEWDQGKWLHEFNSSYAMFLEKLNEQTVDRMPDLRSSQERRSLYLFTRELAGLNVILGEFLEKALHQDKFSTAPHIRGVFFSSCRQEAVPYNPILLATSQKYEITPPILPIYSGASKRYFSSKLFSTVIFKEAGLAGDNNKIERAKRIALVGSGLAASLAYVGFVSLYWLAYEDNRARANEIIAISETFDNLLSKGPAESSSSSGQSYIQSLGALTDANSIFGDYRDRNWLGSALLLYQGRKIGPEIENAYIDMLDRYFLPEVAEYVRNEIAQMGKNDRSRDSNERLEALRVYLMLSDANRRNPALVNAWMEQKWQEQFEGNMVLQQALANHLNFAIETAQLETEMDKDLVEASQYDLREVPRDLRLYRNIEQLSDRQLVSPVNFRNDIGPAYNVVFGGRSFNTKRKDPISVKELFTKDAYLNFFVKMSGSLSVIAVEDAWVANERETVQYSEADLAEFRRKVVARYATNYISVWNTALNQLEVTDFRNLDHAVDVLETLTGPDEPLKRLLNRVKKETEIYEGKLVELNANQAVNSDLPFDLDREQGLRVRRAFSQLNSLVDAKEGEKAYLEDLEAALINLYEYLKEIRQAGTRSGEVALVRAKARINLQGDDPIYTIKRLGVDLPEPLNRFFATLADQSWKVLLQKAKGELQREWNEEVYADYNLNYAPLYPFNNQAEQEIPLQEFEAFFGPGGKIESFYKKNLIVFIDEATGEPEQIEGRHLAIEKEFQEKLKDILDLRKQYFNTEGLIGVEYNIQPASLSGKLRRAVMNIEAK